VTSVPAPPAITTVPAAPRPDAELVFWQSISSGSNPADFEEYLRKYPDGQFSGLARNRMVVLRVPPPQIQSSPMVSAEEALRRAKAAEAPHYMANGKWDNDYAEALRWYRVAAVQGNAQAQLNLGIYYESALATARDYAEALRWYRKAAENGDAQAAWTIGIAYELGRGVTTDYNEAMHWYQKAAEAHFAKMLITR
jgi:TPR repeat protein